MPPKDKTKLKKSPKVLKSSDDDDDSVDSKGNICNLVDYEYTSNESTASNESDESEEHKIVPRKAAIAANKRIHQIIRDSKLKKSVTPSKRKYPFKKLNVTTPVYHKKIVSPKYEEESEESEESEEEEEKEEKKRGFNGILLTLSGPQASVNNMKPIKYNMKKESEIVQKFVELLTKPIENNSMDTHIDQFKSLSEDKQKDLIHALEHRVIASNSGLDLMLNILTIKLPSDIKSMVLAKYNSMQNLDTSSNEYFKLRAWLDKVVSIPFGIYKDIPVNINDGSEKCLEFMKRSKKCLDDAIFGQEDSKLQIMQFISTKITNPSHRGLSLLLAGPPGIGKCHAKDTPILLWNGDIKMVQDIEVGDVLMGDDSTPRNVLSLGKGMDMMYDIIPVKGEKYTVNSEHILCLTRSRNGSIKLVRNKYNAHRFENSTCTFTNKSFPTKEEASAFLNDDMDTITEISVKNYLTLSNKSKKLLKGYRTGIDFPYIEPEFDPYIIGLWLGDKSKNCSIINQDSAVVRYLYDTLPKYNLILTHKRKYDYTIRPANGKNSMLMTIKKHSMQYNKHIPNHFKINSREVRLQVLAGIIDSNGRVASGTYKISEPVTQFANDIVYLSRSLGFAAYIKKKKTSWTYKNEKKYGETNIIHISGNSEIPVKIERKRITEQNKNVFMYGITVKEVGYGEYYGFTLDSNHRYVMGDFTVTHNTALIKNGIAKALDWPFQFISLGGDSDASTYTGHQLVYESSHCGKIVNSLIASKSMSTILMFDEIDKLSQTPKGEEVMNLLIHLTDPVQNGDFEDKYLAGVPIDLSKVMFIFSANDVNKIDRILLDRMMVINLNGYDVKQKTTIAEQYLLPIAVHDVNLHERISISKDILTYIVEEYAKDEKGVRELKRCIEQVTQKINMLRLYNSPDLPFYIKDFILPFIVKKDHIKLFLKKKESDAAPLSMYM